MLKEYCMIFRQIFFARLRKAGVWQLHDLYKLFCICEELALDELELKYPDNWYIKR
jgi:hypothetical protein